MPLGEPRANRSVKAVDATSASSALHSIGCRGGAQQGTPSHRRHDHKGSDKGGAATAESGCQCPCGYGYVIVHTYIVTGKEDGYRARSYFRASHAIQAHTANGCT